MLNQYTNRTVPGFADVVGVALATKPVYVNGQMASRKGEYFRRELSVSNGGGPVWLGVTVTSPGEPTVTGNLFVPRTPEVFTHDLDGNLTSDGRWAYTWDAENRLLRVQSRSDTPQASWRRVQWQYDALGRWIRQATWTYLVQSNQWVVTEDLKFLSDPLLFARHVLDLNASNNVAVRTYVWGLDLSESLKGAGGVGGLLWVTLHSGSGPTAGTHFCAYDGNGNIVALTSASDSSPTARYEYGPFGEPIRVTGPAAALNPFRFSTKRADNTTDLVLYECRAYQPSTGRWPNRDPLGETGGRNLYAFVGNSPVNFVDPFGLERIELWFAAFISPSEIRFPYYSNPNAFWHGDDRGFNPGTRPMSSRVWHWVVVETDPSKKPVVANILGTGLATVTTCTVFGIETTRTGLADPPPVATITRSGCKINVSVSANTGNPLVVGAPHIKYSYNITLDVEKGQMTVSGSHGVFPWHEGNTTKGQAEQFTPAPGAAPADLFKSPTPITTKTFTIEKYPCCDKK